MNRLPAAGSIENREAGAPRGYPLFRGLIRIWLKLARRPIRMLGEEPGTTRSGPLLLVAGHPPSFAASLILIAAFDQPVRCFLAAEHIHGIWAKLIARALGVIPDWGDAASLEAACRPPDRGETLLAFADTQPLSADGDAQTGGRTARLVMELENRLAGSQPIGAGAAQLALVPVYVFLPQSPRDSSQALIHLEPPVRPHAESRERSAGSDTIAGKDLLQNLEPAFRRNVFRLRPADLRDFLSDLEGVLCQEFESRPATPPERKPKLDGFALSEFLVDWAEQENRIDPGRLVSLRCELDSYLERQRVQALRAIESETCGPWISSAWRRAAAWAETLAGFPVAVFGFVNGIVALAVLKAAGLARIERRGENLGRWLARAGIVSVIFAVQTLACYGRWGRAVAGVYAVAAPVAALYLWRYAWLLAHRTRLLIWKLSSPRAHAQLQMTRREFLQELDRARDAYAGRLGVAH